MNRIALFAAGASLASFLGGCVSWHAHSIEEHPKSNATVLQLRKHTQTLFWGSDEHIFYGCTDKGSELACARLCGGNTDIKCPTAAGGHTNVR